MQTSQTSHRGIVAIILALIAYGSLYPLSISLEAGNADTWIRFFSAWGGKDSLGDLVGNIILFFPLGLFAGMGIAGQDGRTARFVLVLLWGLLFALVLQVLQIYIPERDAALIDVVWNAVGLSIGLVLASATVTTRWLGRIGDQPIPMATLLIAALWGAAELVPLVPSIDPQLIKDSLKPLLLEPRFSLMDSLAAAVGIGVLGQALARILGERSSLAWLLLAAVLVLAAKPFIVLVELDLSTVIGFGLGCAAWAVLLRVDGRQRALVLLLALVFVLTASSLEPFQLAHRTNPMGWVPFADVLEGSMLINSQALATSLFTYTAILWLVQLRGGSLIGASLLLALWVALLEFAQIFLVGRTPSITGPLWVILVAVTLARLADTPWPVGERCAFASRPAHLETAAPSTPVGTRPWRRVLIAFAAVAGIGAIPLWIVVRLPGVPYNLRELLLGDSHLLAAWVFMLALLWVGAGAAWMGHQIHGARWPILRIPLTAFAAAMVSLLLLNRSVTQESIRDVTGSINLHSLVTNRDIWGEQARSLFLALGPDLVAFVERPVRFAALYGPVVIFLAIAQAAWLQLQDKDSARAVTARVSWLLLNALPWLLLCLAIAFDWASTDNLTELITRQGPLGIKGDYYIYALIAVLAVNAVAVAHVRSVRTALIALFVSILCIPLSWWLLNLGLEDQVQKYGLTFSGVQFLLGPDRSDLLSEHALFARWVAVQIAVVVTFALGLRVATPVFGPAARPKWWPPEARNTERSRRHRSLPWPRFGPAVSLSLGAIALATVLALAALLPGPHPNPEPTDYPLLPEPHLLPPVDLPGFLSVHPRFPAPSPADIQRLQAENPRYLEQARKRAKGGEGALETVILMAYLEPGSQDLTQLHQRLMALELSWRGHQQAKPLALAYDWLHDQWQPEQRAELREKLADAGDYLVERIRTERLSAYNVYLYNSPFQALVAVALALYDDDPRGEPIMRFTYDLWKHRVLPVWRQVMGEQGGWHEGGEYVGIGIGQAVYQVPALWSHVTGEDLFRTESGLCGFLDFLVYRTRPDGTHFRWGDAGHFNRAIPDQAALAVECRHSAGYTPVAPRRPTPQSWPWGPLGEPSLVDDSARERLPWVKLFDGLGLLVARRDWTPEATYVTFKAGDNYWSHSHLDQGAFTIYRGGALAIDSGLYGSRYGSDHHMNYTYQTIAHNTITVIDPAETTPAPSHLSRGNEPRPIANDGGQRRVGSGWGLGPAPIDLEEWMHLRDMYHTGEIRRLVMNNELVVVAADITAAYTNRESGDGNFSPRTRRVERLWRTFIYDRVDDVIIVYDQVASTRPEFRKRWLLHSQEVPLISGNRFEIEVPPQEPEGRQGGRLTGHVMLPLNAHVTSLGGPGFEFFVDGKNYDDDGRVQEIARTRKKDAEPGAWRIEVSPLQDSTEDLFLVVMLPTNWAERSTHQVTMIGSEEAPGVEISGEKRRIRWQFVRDELGGRAEIVEGDGNSGTALVEW